tara:strand:- start:10471 stop:12246 length:1776 start_codon:yes stop_codon:yes gene_type:complete
MDKNSLTGAILIVLIWIVFSTFFLNVGKDDSIDIDKNQSLYEQSNTSEVKNENQNYIKKELEKKQSNIFNHLKNGENGVEVLENEKIKLLVNRKGGNIESVFIKEYKTYNGEPLDLFSKNSKLNLQFFNKDIINTSELYFTPDLSGNILRMLLKFNDEEYIEYIYTISDEYLVDFDINFSGINNVIKNNYVNLEWGMITPKTEKSKSNQDMYTGLYFQDSSDKEVDNLSLTKEDEEIIKYKLNWVAFKQQFFSAILIAKDGFDKPITLKSKSIENEDSIKDLYANFEIPITKNNSEKDINLQFYFGPNHYKTLQKYDSKFEELIPLGWGIFGWVNKYIIINIFDFLSRYITNYGVIILLLTIIIKLSLAPFTYKAFLSQAKMKVLKPEIDKINEKNKGKDPMKLQQATMNFYRKAGVNPMGGCLPMLFQFPILIAMFRFFPASIELRQQSFLWADDLSAYDSIYELGFSIPFYGDHVSLFTLLMTVSTLLYTRMNSSMATGQMAQMKWMMYLMPIMFLGFFNNYAAGLSYYYFLANMFTFGQQAIMKITIDENKLLSQIEENKKKPKKKSNFQKKLEELQKKQEKRLKNRK